jgi:hypothetical protein
VWRRRQNFSPVRRKLSVNDRTGRDSRLARVLLCNGSLPPKSREPTSVGEDCTNILSLYTAAWPSTT